MTSQDRATLAFKVAGLVLITRALCYLGWVYSFFEFLVDSLRGQGGGSPGYLATAAATQLGMPGAFLLGGALLIGFARPISSRLLKPSETGPEPLPQELLRIGLVVLGVYWLFGMVVALALALVHSSEVPHLMSFAPVGAIVLLFVAWPRLPASVLYRRVAVPGRHEAGQPAMLALGIAMLCTYFALRRISFIASTVSLMLTQEAAALELIAMVRGLFVNNLLIESAGFILVAIVAFYAGRLGAWLGGPRGPAEERSLPRVQLSGRTYLTLAIFVSVAYLFVYHLGYLVRSPLFAWRGTEALGALAHLAVVPAVVALAAFALAGRYGWRLGAWLWSRESAEQQDGPSGAALIVAEVGITVVALLTVTNCFTWVATAKLWEALPSAGVLGAWRIGHYLPAGVAAAGMLLFQERPGLAALPTQRGAAAGLTAVAGIGPSALDCPARLLVRPHRRGGHAVVDRSRVFPGRAERRPASERSSRPAVHLCRAMALGQAVLRKAAAAAEANPARHRRVSRPPGLAGGFGPRAQAQPGACELSHLQEVWCLQHRASGASTTAPGQTWPPKPRRVGDLGHALSNVNIRRHPWREAFA